MRLEAALTGDLAKILKQEVEDAEVAVTGGVNEKTKWLQADWRRQAQGAGLGPRVSNAIRAELYPKGKKSMKPAGLVFARAGKGGALGSVGALLQNLDQGAVIRARNVQALAIPTDAVPRRRGGRRMTPVEVEQEFGQDLEFVPRGGGRPPLLVLQNLVAGRRAGSFRKATDRRRQTGRGIVWVVMFVLVRGVTIKKRLDLQKAAQQAADDLPAAILRHYPKRD
ncbi:MAG: DUF6441 family protein [Inquilinus sp.]|uniref:DUF6441 family protein n=1 Tax=Inquilinus sp. TaxID=1932117 RepID=UPI003F39EA59